jgi:lipopolysaccharide transport system ATP-binding protein
MSSEIAIKLTEISKRFPVFESSMHRLASLLLRRRANVQYFEAVKPIDLTIHKGEFLGIIGENGSGKSTLLQLIAGTLAPSSGTIQVNGRVGALLELGAGFNPEFTGRENARLNASILGLSDVAFEEMLPEIIAFADIGDFFDKPVKTYSSGMYVRLAFAVQACVEPDILIVDEALAVGDIFFRLKCYERLERLRERGCTVILVTHSMEDVIHHCDRALLLHHGQMLYTGDVMEAVTRYYALGNSGGLNLEIPHTVEPTAEPDIELDWPQVPFSDLSNREQVSDGAVRCVRLAVTDSRGKAQRIFRQGEKVHVFAEFEALKDLETVVSGIVLRTEKGVIVHGKHSGQDDLPVPRSVAAGSMLRCHYELTLEIATGEYLIDVTVGGYARRVYDARERLTMAELEAVSMRHCVVNAAATFAVVARSAHGFAVQPFYGLARLDSAARIAALDNSKAGMTAKTVDELPAR